MPSAKGSSVGVGVAVGLGALVGFGVAVGLGVAVGVALATSASFTMSAHCEELPYLSFTVMMVTPGFFTQIRAKVVVVVAPAM